MTLQKLAERAGVSKATVAQAERGEAKGKVTIETLNKMAQAMECEFVYAFIPKSSLRDIIKENALKKAKGLIRNADTHMALEDQRVKEDLSARTKMLAEALIEKGDVW